MSTSATEKRIRQVLAGAGIAALGTGAFSSYLAHSIMEGKRQNYEQAWEWQKAHEDTSFYRPLVKEDYTVTSYDGYLLHAQLVKNPEGTDRYIILSHGHSDNMYGTLKYMNLFLRLGFHCIIYDLRGHGANERTFCTFSIREGRDLYEVIRDTRKRFGRQIILGLHGESLGAATSIAALKYTQNIDFVISDCGFEAISPVLRDGMRRMHFPRAWFYSTSAMIRTIYHQNIGKMRPIDSLSGNKVPVLFIHGSEDTLIRPSHSMHMQQATYGYSQLRLIPGAGHAESVYAEPVRYEQYIRKFLTDLLLL